MKTVLEKQIRRITWERKNRKEIVINLMVKNLAKTRNMYASKPRITNTDITFTLYSKISYEDLVNRMVKQKYTDSQEFAILRKSITNGTNEEYQEYNTYVEECKENAKKFIKERETFGVMN